ncbi:hypothetical protein NDU88_006357 [Pleurodeles waltl]|uniref:Uncharacterized protein n=1 Tax=Pleurodeles waltl TaxID=8319 RepID=A0AAV7QHQ1_PLEWA|nr:hypothetical protein NDU88_006357 [Pleurodeles waltl]
MPAASRQLRAAQFPVVREPVVPCCEVREPKSVMCARKERSLGALGYLELWPKKLPSRSVKQYYSLANPAKNTSDQAGLQPSPRERAHSLPLTWGMAKAVLAQWSFPPGIQ